MMDLDRHPWLDWVLRVVWLSPFVVGIVMLVMEVA